MRKARIYSGGTSLLFWDETGSRGLAQGNGPTLTKKIETVYSDSLLRLVIEPAANQAGSAEEASCDQDEAGRLGHGRGSRSDVGTVALLP